MKYDKLVIIPFYVFEKRTNQIFNLKELVNRNIKVEYWDVSLITHITTLEKEFIEGVDSITFTDKDSFRKKLKEDKNKTLYLVYMSFCTQSSFIYRELSKYGCDIAYCTGGVLPSPIFKQENFIRSFFLKLTNIVLWRNKVLSLLKETSCFAPLKYNLTTCLLAKTQYKVDLNTKVVPFNSLDFQLARQFDNPIIMGNYIVFIDQLIPTHPDNKVVGYKDIDENKYYNALNSFFDLIEKKYNCEVVIAAHPVAISYSSCNPFGSRKVFFNKTSNLVKYSIGVLSHYSTAYSFSVLFNKPSIVLTSDDIINKMPIPQAYCLMFANILDWPLINIDHVPENISFKTVNKHKYKLYKYNYITHPDSENIDNANILVSIIYGEV